VEPLVLARRIPLRSQGIFFLLLAICIGFDHGSASRTNIISFYGVYHRTVVLLVLGFGAAATGLWRAASYFVEGDAPLLVRSVMRLVAVGLFALLITPFGRGALLNLTHMTVGVSIALLQLSITLSLVARVRSPRSIAILVVLLLGGAMAAASLPNWNFPFLLPGEVIYQLGFGWCLVEWSRALYGRRAQYV
jgi:hypothetical protein